MVEDDDIVRIQEYLIEQTKHQKYPYDDKEIKERYFDTSFAIFKVVYFLCRI